MKLQAPVLASPHLSADQPTCSDSAFNTFIYKRLSVHCFVIYLFICTYIMNFIPIFSLAS